MAEGTPNEQAAHRRAARQRRERYVRKRSESAARDIWAALIVKPHAPNWQKFTGILRGIQIPQCGCVQCVGAALSEPAEIEILRHAKKAL